MDYQTVEQFWCKLTASDDWISQLACYAHFEQQMPPNSAVWQNVTQSGGVSALVAAIAIIFVVGGVARASIRDGGLIGSWNRRKPPRRVEPRM